MKSGSEHCSAQKRYCHSHFYLIRHPNIPITHRRCPSNVPLRRRPISQSHKLDLAHYAQRKVRLTRRETVRNITAHSTYSGSVRNRWTITNCASRLTITRLTIIEVRTDETAMKTPRATTNYIGVARNRITFGTPKPWTDTANSIFRCAAEKVIWRSMRKMKFQLRLII